MPASDSQLMLSISADTRSVMNQLKQVQKALTDTGNAAKRVGDIPTGNAQRSLQAVNADAKVLSFQLNDIATGLSSGQSPFIIMNQQLGQIMQVMGGRGLVGSLSLLRSAFMTALPAVGLMAAVTAFQMLTEEAEDSEKAIKDANQALQDQRTLVDELRKAQGLEGVDREQSQLNLFVKTREAMAANVAIAGELADKLNEISDEILGIPASEFEGQTYTIQQLDGALRNLAEGIQRGDADFYAFAKQMQEIEKLPLPDKIKAMVTQLIDMAGKAALSAENLENLREALSGVAKEQAEFNAALEVLDEFAKGHLSDLEKILQAYQTAMQGARTLSEAMGITAQAMQGMANTPQAAGQAGSAVDLTEQLLGVSEKVDPARINQFLKAGGVDLDSAATAWCAAFINSALDQMGVKGTGSMAASSFLKWGVNVQPDPGQVRRGDVIVRNPRGVGAGVAGAHVGFATGAERVRDGFHEIEMISGNSAQKVQKTWEKVTAAITVRRGADITPLADQGNGAVDALREARDAAEKATEADKKLAEERQKGQEAYEKALETQQKAIDQQLSENQTLTDTSKSLDQKTLAIEANRIATDLNTEAERNGIVVTDELRQKHLELGMSMAQAKLANDNLVAGQKKTAQDQKDIAKQMEQFNQQLSNIAKSAVSGLVNDLRNGVSAADAFSNALDRIVDGLINMAIEALFAKNALGGGGGGLLSLFGLGGGGAAPVYHGGGTVGLSGRFDGRRFSPAMWAGAPRFARGGMVGLRPGEVPIIAHAGEIVIPRSRSLSGASGAGGAMRQTNNVSISVDTTKGKSEVSAPNAIELGKKIDVAVQRVLVREKRNGGLLSATNPGGRL